MCRLVAACFVTLGVMPVALMFTSLSPHSHQSRIAAGVVLVSCLVMSGLWLRHHWPSREQSLTCAIVGSLAAGASALIASDPLVGFLGASTFVALSAFVVFFHSTRLLAVTWTIAAVVVGLLFARLVSVDLAMALWATTMVILLNVFIAFACWGAIKLVQPDSIYNETDQLTGLLHREAFYRRVATLLASRSRSDDRYLVVVAVNIDSFSLLLGMRGSRGGNRARVAVAQALRETVRHNAIVAHVSDDDFLVADSFTTADASPLVERIRGAIALTPQRLTASIGVVCTPLAPLAPEPPADVVDKLITIAGSAIDQARTTGGNQVRYVLRPVLDEDQDENQDQNENEGEGAPQGGDDWPEADRTA